MEMIFGLLLILLGVSFVAFRIFQRKKDKKALSSYTGYAEGKVIDVEVRNVQFASGLEERYYPTIEFTISDGDTVFPETVVCKYDPVCPKVGYVVDQTVYVMYKKDNYKDFFLAGDINESQYSVIYLLAGIFIFMGFIIML